MILLGLGWPIKKVVMSKGLIPSYNYLDKAVLFEIFFKHELFDLVHKVSDN